MIEKLIARVQRLEDAAVLPSQGKHLVFQIEAPGDLPDGAVFAFLKERGHAIHEDDDVLVMNLGAHHLAEGAAPRDLSPAILTEETRSEAPPAGMWPKDCGRFTFTLDGPGVL